MFTRVAMLLISSTLLLIITYKLYNNDDTQFDLIEFSVSEQMIHVNNTLSTLSKELLKKALTDSTKIGINDVLDIDSNTLLVFKMNEFHLSPNEFNISHKSDQNRLLTNINEILASQSINVVSVKYTDFEINLPHQLPINFFNELLSTEAFGIENSANLTGNCSFDFIDTSVLPEDSPTDNPINSFGEVNNEQPKFLWLLEKVSIFESTEVIAVQIKLASGDFLLGYFPIYISGVLVTKLELIVYILLLICSIILAYLISAWYYSYVNALTKHTYKISENINVKPERLVRVPKEITELEEAVQHFRRQVVNYTKDNTQFFIAMSHDLKSPLTRLQLRIDSLEDPILEKALTKEIDVLDNMIKSSLNYMKYTNKNEELVIFDIHKIMTSIVNNASEFNSNITLLSSTSNLVKAMPDAIYSALNNLVENAVFYGKSVCINIKNCDDFVEIIIQDDGPGIPESEYENVFKPFYRMRNTQDLYKEGSGLGLAIAKHNISNSGGTIRLYNDPHKKGLFVTVKLPVYNDEVYKSVKLD
jgi:signal transduction histidine kinase